jgi:hypothetical protein
MKKHAVGSSLTSRPSAAIACQRPMDSYLGLAGTTGEGNYAAAREGDKVLTAKTSAENVISLMDVLKRISLMDVLKRSLAAESPAVSRLRRLRRAEWQRHRKVLLPKDPTHGRWIRRCQNRGVTLPPGSAWGNPEACPSGIRHVGGAKLNQALASWPKLGRAAP